MHKNKNNIYETISVYKTTVSLNLIRSIESKYYTPIYWLWGQ
jgi:hypothetical protein